MDPYRVAKVSTVRMNWDAFEDEPWWMKKPSLRVVPADTLRSGCCSMAEGRLRLGSRAMDIFVTLVESAGKTIRKDQLIARTWPDTIVDEAALRVHVAALRKALGDGRAGKRYIVNNPGRGYTFVAPVMRERRSPATAAPQERPQPAICLCRSRASLAGTKSSPLWRPSWPSAVF